MNINGLQKLSLLDYPGKVACMLFTQGCNWNCKFCQNSDLIHYDTNGLIKEEDILEYLDKRKKVLDGIYSENMVNGRYMVYKIFGCPTGYFSGTEIYINSTNSIVINSFLCYGLFAILGILLGVAFLINSGSIFCKKSEEETPFKAMLIAFLLFFIVINLTCNDLNPQIFGGSISSPIMTPLFFVFIMVKNLSTAA